MATTGTRPSSVGISFEALSRYTEDETGKWRSWLESQPAAVLDLPFGDAGKRMGAVRDMLSHIFIVEWVYARILSGQSYAEWNQMPRETLADLFAIGEKARGMVRDVLARATEESMAKNLSLSGRGVTITGSACKFLTHFFVHSLRHWAQIATVLRQHGHQTNWEHDFVLTSVID